MTSRKLLIMFAENLLTMKRVALWFLLLVVFVSCHREKPLVQLTDYRSVEGVVLGMPVVEAVKKSREKYFLEKTVIPVDAGEKTKFEYHVFISREIRTFLYSFGEVADSTGLWVSRITLKDARYRLPNGAAIGSTVGELRKLDQFSTISFSYDYGLVLSSGTFNGGYLLDLNFGKDYPGFDFEKPGLSALPDEFVVLEVVLAK